MSRALKKTLLDKDETKAHREKMKFVENFVQLVDAVPFIFFFLNPTNLYSSSIQIINLFINVKNLSIMDRCRDLGGIQSCFKIMFTSP